MSRITDERLARIERQLERLRIAPAPATLPPDPGDPAIHVLATDTGLGAFHTISAAAAGHVLRTTSASSARFAALQHDDLAEILPDQHHDQLHDLTDVAHHTITAPPWGVVGAVNTNTLAILNPLANVTGSVKEALLKSDGSGYITVVRVNAADSVFTPRVTVASGDLLLDPPNDLLLRPTRWTMFADNKDVRSQSHTSGFLGQGWKISWPTTDRPHLDIRSIYAETLEVTAFQADVMRVRVAEDFLTQGMAFTAADFTTPSGINGTVRIIFEGNPALPTAQLFLDGEWIFFNVIRRGTGLTVAQIWGTVSAYQAEPDGDSGLKRQSWLFQLKSGNTSFVVPKNTTVLAFGLSSQKNGYIHHSVLPSAHGPWTRYATWSGSDPYTVANRKYHVQIGNLRGLVDVATDRYGIAAGNDLSKTPNDPTTPFKGFVADNSGGLRLFNTAIASYIGNDQKFYLAPDGTEMWLGANVADKRFHYLNNNLTIVGDIEAGRGGGSVGRFKADSLGVRIRISPGSYFDTDSNITWYYDSLSTSARAYIGMRVYTDGTNADSQSQLALTARGSTGGAWGSVALRARLPDQSTTFDTAGGTLIVTPTSVYIGPNQGLRISSNAADIASSVPAGELRVDTIYANSITTNVISGESMSGSTWAYNGSMAIHADDAGGTVVTVENTGIGSVTLHVAGNITLDGTVDGIEVSLLAAELASHSHLHSTLSGLDADDHTQYHNDTRGDLRYPLKTVTIASGAGLTGGGDLSANRTLAVGAGTLIRVDADTVNLASGAAQYQVPITGGGAFVPAWTNLDTLAGNGLVFGTGVFSVGAGTLISITADAVNLANGTAQYQVPVTNPTPFAPTWTGLGTFAGGGLVFSGGVFAVGAGSAINVAADAVSLITPGSLGVASLNDADGPGNDGAHTHLVASSSSPGAAASLLATDSSGYLTLVRLSATDRLRTPLLDTAADTLTLAPATHLLLQPASSLVKLQSGVAIQSANYASQVTGMRVSYAGEADFRYLFVDEMHAKAFIADLEQALAGGQIITKSVAMVAQPFAAPAIPGPETITFRADAASYSAGPTLTLSPPAGTLADDYMLVQLVFAIGSTVSSAPAGWTMIRTASAGGGTMAVYGKTYAVTDTTYAWTLSPSTGVYGLIQSFDGVATVSPIDVSVSQGNGWTVNGTAPSITTTVDSTVLVHMLGSNAGSVSMTPPAGFTESQDAESNSKWLASSYATKAVAGATGVKTATLSTARDNIAVMVALKPGNGNGGATTLTVRDLPSAQGMAAFAEGDIIGLRTFSRSGGGLDITNCWGAVSGYVNNNDGTQTWTFTRSEAPNAGAMTPGQTVKPDSLALDYGVSGNGFYEVNAIDGIGGINSPYLQFVRWTGHPATGQAVRLRAGQLRGIFGQDEFGFFVGTGTADSDRWLRLSDYAAGNGLNNLPFRLRQNGATKVAFESWDNVWFGPSEANKLFSWNGSNLAITGSITVTGGNAATSDDITTVNNTITTGLAGKISVGNAAQDINTNITTINGGKITTGTIVANRLAVTAGGENLLLNSSFEADTDANGTADNWTIYNSSAAQQPVTASRVTGRTGGLAQRLSWSVANTTSKGLIQAFVSGRKAGVWYTISWWARQNLTAVTGMDLYHNNAPAAEEWVIQPTPQANTWQRWAKRMWWAADNTDAMNISITYGASVTGTLDFDDVMVHEGDVPQAYMPRSSEIMPGTIVGSQINLQSYLSINSSTFGQDGIQLEYNGGNPRAYIGDGANRFFKFDGTTITWKAANAELDANGNLIATSATLSGAITATSGAIGGWSVVAGGITSTNAGLYSGTDARLEVGSGSSIAGVTGNGSTLLWAGSTYANRASASFKVSNTGALTATGATVSGAITATSGSISGTLSIGVGGKIDAGNVWIDTAGLSLNALAGKFTSSTISWWQSSTRRFSIGTVVDLGSVTSAFLEANGLSISYTAIEHDFTGDINSAGNITAPLHYTSGAGGGYMVATRDTGNSWMIYNTGGQLYFWENNTNRAGVTNGGTVFAGSFKNNGGYYFSNDVDHRFLDSTGAAAKRIYAGGLLVAGDFRTTAEGGPNNPGKIPASGIYTSGGIAIATSDGLTSGYSLDVNSAARFRSSIAVNAHINLTPISAPSASATTSILYVGTDNKLYYMKPNGTPILVAG